MNPTIGKGVEKALLRALAKDPAQRFETATAFAEALTAGMAEDTRGGTMPTVVVRGAEAKSAATSRPASTPMRTPAPVTPQLILAQRPIVFATAGALVLAIVAVSVIAMNASRTVAPASPTGPEAAATGAATAAASGATTALKFAVPPKGALLWEAKLDGTDIDVRGAASLGLLADPTASDVHYVPGGIEFVINKAQGGRNIQLNSPVRDTFILEVDVDPRVGGVLQLGWWGAAGSPRYAMGIDTRSSRIQLEYYKSPTTEPLTASVPADGVRRGNRFTAAVVVERTLFMAYVDQLQIVQAAPDGRIAPAAVPINIFFGGSDTGTLRLTGIRLYELPAVSTSPVGSGAPATAPVSIVATPAAAPAPATAAPTRPATSATAAPSSAAAPTSATAPTAATTPKFAIPAKGALLWQASLTGTVEVVNIQANQGDPANFSVTFPVGAIELATKARDSGGLAT